MVICSTVGAAIAVSVLARTQHGPGRYRWLETMMMLLVDETWRCDEDTRCMTCNDEILKGLQRPRNDDG